MNTFVDVRPYACLLAILAISCGGDSSGARTVTASTSQAVTSSGGTLAGPMGTQVVVPAGAVTSGVTIVASALSGVRPRTGTAAVGQAVRLGPEGTTFNKVVEVTIPVSPSSLGGRSLDEVVVIRSTQDSDVFVPLPTRRAPSGNAVIAATEHFSDFVPVLIMPNATPFGSCGNTMCESATESCSTCPDDCGVCLAAGECANGTCEPNSGETCSTCEYDCGACTNAVCGDGLLEGAETCDPAIPGGTSLETCGCDDGDPCTTDNFVTGTAATCDVVCASVAIPACVSVCGDGFVSGVEACDDGNTIAGDGCDATCSAIEAGYACPVPAVACYFGTCGNAQIEGIEVCDDGNAIAGDGCNDLCVAIEPLYVCPVPGMPCVPDCGDGMTIGGEICDDGNVMTGDGCDASCMVEVGYVCPPGGGTCTFVGTNVCGDGTVGGIEVCDDGPMNGTYGFCNAACTGPGLRCGDAIVQVGFEDCDDGIGGVCPDTCMLPVPNGKLHVFTTAGTNGALGGTAGADAFCMAAPNRPTSGMYKALLVTSTRRACSTPNCLTAPDALDWVMLPSTTYYFGPYGTEMQFMSTDTNAIVTQFPLGGSLGLGMNFWLGMNVDWTPNASNCVDFTSALGTDSSTVGWDADSSMNFFAGGSYVCNATAKVLCIEQ